MAVTRAVRDPKNGVVSCWVCTGVLIVIDVMRLLMLHMNSPIVDWVFIGLIAVWVIISTYETIKYVKMKKGVGKGNGGN